MPERTTEVSPLLVSKATHNLIDKSDYFEIVTHLCPTFYKSYFFREGAGIATSYGLDDREVGVRVPAGSRIFSSPRRPDRLWGPANLQSPEVKWPGREADYYSPPASAEVKKGGSIQPFTPPYVSMA
jgi:hypothetical protein